MPSSTLARCLRLLEVYERRDPPPWRRRPLMDDPPPAPLTLGELHRLWRALLAEGGPVTAPGLAAVLAEPCGLACPPAEEPPSEAAILRILRSGVIGGRCE